MRDQHHPHPARVQPGAGGDVAGRRAHQAEQHAHRQQREERIDDARRLRPRMQRPGQQLQAAARRDLRGRDVVAGEKVRRRVQQRRQQHGKARPGFAFDRGVHRTAQERLLDERHREAADQAQRSEPQQIRAAEVCGRRPLQQPERTHQAHHRQHARHAEDERERHLAQERAARQPVAEAGAVGEPQVPRDEHEPHQQRQHADALADAVEREVDIRVQQRPRRVAEYGDGRQRQPHQCQKPGKSSHRL